MAMRSKIVLIMVCVVAVSVLHSQEKKAKENHAVVPAPRIEG